MKVESAFERANDFVPERWYSKPEMVKNKHAYAPFGIGEIKMPDFPQKVPTVGHSARGLIRILSSLAPGRASCVGQGLAMTQIRLVLASLVKRFHLKFLPGEDGREVVRDMRDRLTAQPGKLTLVFEHRE